MLTKYPWLKEIWNYLKKGHTPFSTGDIIETVKYIDNISKSSSTEPPGILTEPLTILGRMGNDEMIISFTCLSFPAPVLK